MLLATSVPTMSRVGCATPCYIIIVESFNLSAGVATNEYKSEHKQGDRNGENTQNDLRLRE
jgi:hypothetical protein